MRTELGTKLKKIRNAYIAKGGALLDEAGLERELAERRGGVKAYISKHALSTGYITELEGTVSDDGDIFTFTEDDETYEYTTGQWFTTKEDAAKAATMLRDDTIRIYQMRINNLQRLVFNGL